MEAQDATTETWFHKMEGYLDWRVIGPDVTNPFGIPISTPMLKRMATSRELLQEFMNIRCLCDGFEVLVVENLKRPRVESDHPCVSRLSTRQILRFIKEETDLASEIDDEIDRLQGLMQEELDRRAAEVRKALNRNEKTMLKRIQAKRQEEEQRAQNTAVDSGYRILKKG